jgi:nitric oxide reductase NorE protein
VSTISENTRQAAPPPGKQKHLPGEEGTWVFILGDMTVFAVFFATYLYYRGQQRELFISSQHALVQGYGVINTILLLISSLFVVIGMRAVRAHRTDLAPWMFVGAMVCGLGFTGMKFLEWGEKLSHGITPATNSFFMYYFILTGLHFFHLLLGMGVLTFLARTSRQAVISPKRFAFVEGGACFWHMVDLLWIVLFPLLYLVK